MGQITLALTLDDCALTSFNQTLAQLGIKAETYFELCARELIKQNRLPFDVDSSEVDFDMTEEEACDFAARHASVMIDHAR